MGPLTKIANFYGIDPTRGQTGSFFINGKKLALRPLATGGFATAIAMAAIGALLAARVLGNGGNFYLGAAGCAVGSLGASILSGVLIWSSRDE